LQRVEDNAFHFERGSWIGFSETMAYKIAKGANKSATERHTSVSKRWDNAFHPEYVSASRRNQHASGVCSPEFPLRQRLQHQSMSLWTGHFTNGAFLFVQQKRVALRFPPLSW
jgi:hypothetical protein